MGKSKQRSADAQVVEAIRKELVRRKGTWKDLPDRSSKAFTYRWVAAFAAGDIKEPSYTRLAALGRLMGINITATERKKKGDGPTE